MSHYINETNFRRLVLTAVDLYVDLGPHDLSCCRRAPLGPGMTVERRWFSQRPLSILDLLWPVAHVAHFIIV